MVLAARRVEKLDTAKPSRPLAARLAGKTDVTDPEQCQAVVDAAMAGVRPRRHPDQQRRRGHRGAGDPRNPDQFRRSST